MSHPDEALVREQLERIVCSPPFARSPQAARFLRFVVFETLGDRASALKAFTIGVQALGAQSERSDPDSIARMQARRVRGLLDTYYASVGKMDAIRISLPTGSYEPRFARNRVSAFAPTDPRPVLLFEGYSAQGPTDDGQWLASALDESVAAALLSFGNVRMWRAAKSTLKEPAAFVLGGSIWVAGGRVRAFTALRDGQSGERLCYDRFDGSLEDGRFFEIQDEICDSVCSRVADPTTGVIARTMATREPRTKAAIALSHFHDEVLAPAEPGVAAALELVEEALAIEPDSVSLLVAASLLGAIHYAADPAASSAALDDAETRARKAVVLAPYRFDARLAKAFTHFHRREAEAAKAELKRAMSENPRALLTLYWGGVLLAMMGDWEPGLDLLRRATARFPEAPGFHHIAPCLYHLGQGGSVDGAYCHAKLFDTPHTAWGSILLAVCQSAIGKRYLAKRSLSEALARSPVFAANPRSFLSGYIYDPVTLEAAVAALEDCGLRHGHERTMPLTPSTGRRGAIVAASRRQIIPVGILHSLSGTMAICEQPLVDAALLAIEELNAQGGVLGREIVAFVEDGGSQAEVFATKARKLIETERVATLFGCWTSSSRKAVRTVVEHYDVLLWYPVQYEGLETCRNIIYTGSCLNQQIEPATRWMLSRGKKRFFLVGSDYVFPRTANQLIRALVESAGCEIVGEEYRPLGAGGFAGTIELIRRLKPDVVLSTINGADNLAFFAELGRLGLGADVCPVMSFSLSELELSRAPGIAAGHYACWSYFRSIDGPENAALQERFERRFGERGVLSDPTLTAYAQVHLWKQAVDAAGSVRTAALLTAVVGRTLQLGGERLEVRPNHHVQRRALIGRIRADGQFDVVWSSVEPIAPRPWLGVEETNLEARALILEALGSLSNVVDYTTTLEHEMARHRPPERGSTWQYAGLVGAAVRTAR